MTLDPLAAAMPAAPVVAALVCLLLPMGSRRIAAAFGVGGAAVAFACAVALVLREPATQADTGIKLADFDGLQVRFGTFVNGPAGLVAVAVTVVALCVQIYSISYLSEDDRYAPYAGQVSLFTGAMLLVVVTADLIPLLVGWEIMGICSYLLIGHDRKLPEAPGSAVKAFLVTRFGDVGFILGVAILATNADSFRIDTVIHAHYSTGTVTAATILLLGGVAGKSAQFPLHTWLPDAMAGPTPISALIHAATMVAAGVYLVARLYPIFPGTTLAVLAVMASITMVLAATTATSQDDVKKVLAWSTVSQIGYMTGGLAVGAGSGALLHLLGHAAFKALLFLCAGSLIHAVHSNYMKDMGGLRKKMPVTFVTMTLGLAALAGLPPLTGFVTKDAILTAAERAATDHTGLAPSWVPWLVWIAGLTTTALTGWYSMRLWLRTFFGPSAAKHPHEPSWLMRGPLVLLAVPTVGFGLFAMLPVIADRLELEGAGPFEVEPFEVEAVLPMLLAIAGAAIALLMWRRAGASDPAAKLPGRPMFAAAYWLDAVQDTLVVRRIYDLSRAVTKVDVKVVDGAVLGTGRTALGLGTLFARAHRAALPRAATATLAGVLILTVAIVVGVR